LNLLNYLNRLRLNGPLVERREHYGSRQRGDRRSSGTRFRNVVTDPVVKQTSSARVPILAIRVAAPAAASAADDQLLRGNG
jgi:hypothetical protein